MSITHLQSPPGIRVLRAWIGFVDRDCARDVLESAVIYPGLELSVRRGRITRSRASIDVELRGRMDVLGGFLELCRRRGASVRVHGP